MPVSRTRAQRFDDLVRDEVRRVADRLGPRLDRMEFAVEEVPPVAPWADGTDEVPLHEVRPAAAGRPARIVVYRRPVELRGGDETERGGMIRRQLTEAISELLGVSPESIDPGYGDPDEAG